MTRLYVPMHLKDGLRRGRRVVDNHKLLELLSIYRCRLCTDPRDKVYGLLGLGFNDERETIFPDYSIPVALVYERLTFSIIENKQNIDIFSQVYHFLKDVKPSAASLPSWVPDWTLNLTDFHHAALQVRQEWNESYNASLGSFTLAKHMSGSRIMLQGIILGVVAILGTSRTPWETPTHVYKNWRNIASIETQPDRLYGKTSTKYLDVFWQTLFCSIFPTGTNLYNTFRRVRTCNDIAYRGWYHAWWSWISEFDADKNKLYLVSSEYSWVEIDTFNAGVTVSTRMRPLLISQEEEWLGLAPEAAQPGDVIALLAGGSVPYILQTRNDGSAGEYVLVGDAYVHGIMDGEKWNPELLQDIILV